jgi:hypothetical protein
MFQTLVHRQGVFLSLKATTLQLHNFEVRFETYVGVQTFYKSYNKKWFLIVHQLV